MDQATHNKIVSFIWGIADDVLRDLFKRGKYPDVILPMCVLRRMDAVLEPTKQAVLDTKQMLDDARITEQRAALADAAGQAFYNTSRFTLRDLKSRGSHQQLLADFEDYLNGFSPNVQDILDNFKFRNQLTTLSKADALGTLINKFLDPDIDLSPAGIDNHSMGTVFEELVRKFNEDNNEEAGEHWTSRDAVRLMANLVFLPVEDQIKSGTYLLFDDACGTGGILTVAEETLTAIGKKRGLQVEARLYGQEINPEAYAICKADMLIKGEGENADHIVGGAEWMREVARQIDGGLFERAVLNPPKLSTALRGMQPQAEQHFDEEGKLPPRSTHKEYLSARCEDAREVLTNTPDAWVNNDATKINSEFSFARRFYKPKPLLCWNVRRRLSMECPQGGRAGYGNQTLVTASRDLTVDHDRDFKPKLDALLEGALS